MNINDFEQEKRDIIKRYAVRFQKYGIDVRTLNSGSIEKQFIRHEVHASIGKIKGHAVLDIGCGFADFYSYLKEKSESPSLYIGWDIVEAFIDINRERFPECTFELRDALSLKDCNLEVDYIIMSQVFNNKYKTIDNGDLVKEVLKNAFSIARKGVSIDMMSSYVDYREEKLYYFQPEEMFCFAKGLTRYVVLRHDYLPFEFTLYLYKK